MTPPNPPTPDRGLHSPTLAQLYLAQGHLDRAREQVLALLADDPFSGVALALNARLSAMSLASATRLALDVDREIILRWDIPDTHWREHARLDLVLCVTPRGTHSTPHYLSGPADRAQGEMHLPFPYPRGSASACIAALVGPRRRFRPFAVSASASW